MHVKGAPVSTISPAPDPVAGRSQGPPAGGEIPDDPAVTFLTSLAPGSSAERTRAFAALLRAMTAEPRR